jgi:steroid 5-alpha reductase family enzyme
LLNLFLADLIGSLVIYINCVCLNNFSIYDPYWTVQSSVLSAYYVFSLNNKADNYRLYIVAILVNTWSIRLTSNFFLNGINSIHHEDWHYTQFRVKMNTFSYFISGFFMFILIPTLLVFVGCTPLYYIALSDENMNYLDLLAFIIIISAIIIEGVADTQLRNKLKTEPKDKRIVMDEGLWSLSRHPNYFGEISFWFGLYVCGLSSGASVYDQFYAAVFFLGPFAIFSLIYFGSLPMMEDRQLERRKTLYSNYMQRVTFKLLPLNFLFKSQVSKIE